MNILLERIVFWALLLLEEIKYVCLCVMPVDFDAKDVVLWGKL